jgi:hypothetical protein
LKNSFSMWDQSSCFKHKNPLQIGSGQLAEFVLYCYIYHLVLMEQWEVHLMMTTFLTGLRESLFP